MKDIVVVKTERLILRQFVVEDGAAMNRVYGDPEVMKFSLGVRTSEWVRERLRGCLDDYHRLGFGLWAVVERTTNEVIGYCGLGQFQAVGREPEIELGYRLARPYWGRGFATEAARAVRDYSFRILNLSRLVALIDPQNFASIHVAEKIGLRYEAEIMLEGYSYPDHLYSIARSVNPPVSNSDAPTERN